jgi:hypothetical protein
MTARRRSVASLPDHSPIGIPFAMRRRLQGASIGPRLSKGGVGLPWLPDRMGCRNLQGLPAGLCLRGGETALDDFLVGDNPPVPVASRTVLANPVRKRVFWSHDVPNDYHRSGSGPEGRLESVYTSIKPCSAGGIACPQFSHNARSWGLAGMATRVTS